MTISRVLFPGRFQPFHKGHMKVVMDLLDMFDEIVIAVGSAQEGFTCRNPFTAGERLEMIRLALRSAGVDLGRIWLIPVPDIHKPLAWTSYLLGLAPRITAVASGNPHVVHLYKWLGYRVVEISLFNHNMFNGTVIRNLIARGLPWEDRVPSVVAEYIRDIGGVERIKKLCSREC